MKRKPYINGLRIPSEITLLFAGAAWIFATVTMVSCSSKSHPIEEQNHKEQRLRENEIGVAISSIIYAKDERTGLCFAATNFTAESTPKVFTYVPCDRIQMGGMVLGVSDGPNWPPNKP